MDKQDLLELLRGNGAPEPESEDDHRMIVDRVEEMDEREIKEAVIEYLYRV